MVASTDHPSSSRYAADPDQARFELFDGVTSALARLAAERPLLCLVDDLHAADVPTLELVPSLRGMALQARLVATPHVEIHSLELVSGSADDVDGGDAASSSTTRRAHSTASGSRCSRTPSRRRKRAATWPVPRPRATSTRAERARVTAQRRVRDPIRTGTFCVYRPV